MGVTIGEVPKGNEVGNCKLSQPRGMLMVTSSKSCFTLRRKDKKTEMWTCTHAAKFLSCLVRAIYLGNMLLLTQFLLRSTEYLKL